MNSPALSRFFTANFMADSTTAPPSDSERDTVKTGRRDLRQLFRKREPGKCIESLMHMSQILGMFMYYIVNFIIRIAEIESSGLYLTP